MTGYDFTKDDLTTLLLRRFYPERTDRESRVIRDWLLNHGVLYDRFTFSVRVGTDIAVDPSLPLRLQKQQQFVARKRMDILAWRGSQPTIIEVKYLVTPASLGQILSYRQFFKEELPDAPDPLLVVIGAAGDPDTIRVLNQHGCTVYIYPEAQPSDSTTGGGV